MTSRRHFLQSATGAAAALALPAWSKTDWPTGPITLVDPFPAGGSTDYFSRLLADRLGPLLGTQVIVDNKPGAGGIVGATYLSKAKPDGYTIGMASVSTLCAGPAVQPPTTVRYNPIKDFTFISLTARAPP